MIVDDEQPEGEIEIETGDEPEAEAAAPVEGDEAAAEPEADDDDEIVIELEGIEGEPAEETPVIRKMRQELREKDRRLKEYEKAAAPAPIEVGNKPDLWEDCDGDPEKFEAELSAFHDRKAKAENQQAEQTKAKEAAEAKLASAYAGFKADAAALRVANFDAAEKVVGEALPPSLKGVLVEHSKKLKSPELVLALSRHPLALKRIAETAEADPVAALIDLTLISERMKVFRRTKAPPPEEIVRGSAPLSRPGADKEEEKLLSEANRTGDMTKYSTYMREKRQRAKAA